MAEDKKAMRDLFASKVEDAPEEEVVEEEVVEDMPEETMDEEPMEEETPDEANVIVDGCKEAYAVFEEEAVNDPKMALDNLIETLGSLRGQETPMDEEEYLPAEDAPLNEMPLNM